MSQDKQLYPGAKVSGFLTPAAIMAQLLPARYGEFLSLLPPTTRSVIETPPLAMSWVPLEYFPPLIQAALVVFDGNLDRVAELAERSLNADLSTVYRIFIRIASPEFILDRAPAVWSTYVRRGGELRVSDKGPRWRILSYTDVPYPSKAYWAYQRGALFGVLRATGVTSGEVSIVEGGNDEHRCSMKVSW